MSANEFTPWASAVGFWNKNTGELRNVLAGHESEINTDEWLDVYVGTLCQIAPELLEAADRLAERQSQGGVMSARELLKRTLKYLTHTPKQDSFNKLCNDIEAFLDSNDRDPEPVAWLEKSADGNWFLAYSENKNAESRPLYTEQPDQAARIADLDIRVDELEKMVAHWKNITSARRIRNNQLEAKLAAIGDALDYDEIESAATEININLPEDRDEYSAFANAIHRTILARLGE